MAAMIYAQILFIMESYVDKPGVITTSLTARLAQTYTAQLVPKCANFELRAVECYEAYGFHGAQKKKLCQNYLDDLKECIYQIKSYYRISLMRQERKRQYKEGIRDEIYAPSPIQDSS
uniref:NADH-ubiquinone oxidoreductase 15 kDa subunit n=1 Tax=Vespula pensylvanica TaxID=30213 RepID=A0A834UEZ0_VESPE|nr:hypothetical protein H0235_003439 [Vespula pensylvanica]